MAKDPSRDDRPGDAPDPAPRDPWRVEGSRKTEQRPSGGKAGAAATWISVAVLLALYVVMFVLFASPAGPIRLDIPYSVFREQAQRQNVAEITATGETIQGRLRKEITYASETGSESSQYFKTERPVFANDQIFQELLAGGATIGAKPTTRSTPLWESLLFAFGPILLIGGLFVMFMRRTRGLGGGLSTFGKARARRYERDEQRTTFADVAGIDEATEDLAEVVDFLKDPDRYRALGAMVPRGVLLTGPPGTGKTLLARAVAGEAEVPFLSLSASEFVEMYVGVGASRVRDLFEQAKKEAPAIIFIDELDAIGRSRGAGSFSSGGHDEREQTLNQVLTEMDGFTGNEGVIVLAATNRPEILDSALLRPGRFDRRVAVSPPDQKGRQQILEVHARSVPLAEDVDLATVASSTPGMVGADLRNLVNEAALLAAHRGRKTVSRDELADALEKIVLGAARHILISEDERERTAYHEAGHALIGMLEPGADPVRKVSIIPRGHALGVTFQSPDNDRYGFDERFLRGRMAGLLGGRAAEELIYGAVTTGAESDLDQATALARHMVGRWGMSDKIGLVTVLPPDGSDPFMMGEGAPSEGTRQLVDAEIRRISDECHARAVSMLGEHREQLDALARALLEHETLDEPDAYAAARVPHANHVANAT